MNAAAQELAMIGAAKRREPILERARQIWIEQGKEPPAGLFPPLVLTASDRIGRR